ncbi:hypothetical protein MMC19_007694 [Ptychographa xylographoides]|nr:hypothetical protein [Ptychographa xylographoides]
MPPKPAAISSSPSSSSTAPLVSIISGGVAGGIEAGATYPFEFAKTRVQLRNSSTTTPTPRNPFVVVSQVFRTEGPGALYKGCTALIVGSVAKDAVRFLSFDTIKNAFKDQDTGTLTPARNLLAGMSAGVVASVFAVTPTERIKTALIDDARAAKRFRSPQHAVLTIWREHGLGGLYRGLIGTTLKQASATAFRMGTYNILKDYETGRGMVQGTGMNFVNGSVAGIVTTYMTQPFDCLKTRAQSAEGVSTVEAFRTILADDGLRGFWRGTTMRLGRTIFSGGILFTVYEQVATLVTPLVGR